MERQVGLLIMKDENDILNEYLTKITRYFDKILVLDGSEDNEGSKICSNFPEVIFYEKDKNALGNNINDSTTRGYLWEEAKRTVDNKSWVGILHPDEFPTGNVLDMLEYVDNVDPDAEVISISNMHFFLHTSQRDSWNFKPGDLIEQKMKYYMDSGRSEQRYFKFDKKFVYGVAHHRTIPENTGRCHTLDFTKHNFKHKQFSYRFLDQAIKRAKSRWDSGWQMDDYLLVLETGDIFFDSLIYPEEYRKKYPEQYSRCWYNSPGAHVEKLD